MLLPEVVFAGFAVGRQNHHCLRIDPAVGKGVVGIFELWRDGRFGYGIGALSGWKGE